MKSYFFTLFLGISILTIPLRASFAEIEVYKTPFEQPIFLLGDAHDHKKERDGHYFDSLLKIFEEADNDATADPDTTEYVVFVENSPSMKFEDVNPRYDRSKNILANLYDTVKEKPFRRTKVIDCDPRHVSKALNYLFGAGESLFPFFRRNQSRQDQFKTIYKVGYFEVTFQDVANSFDDLKNQMLQFRSQWQDPNICETFDTILAGLQKERLLRVFQEYSIDAHQTIFDYLGNMTRFDPKRKKIKNKITNIFCQFVDLFVLHNLLLQSNNPKIKKFIIITGTGHIWRITSALQSLKRSYKPIYREIPSTAALFFKTDGLRILQLPLSSIIKNDNHGHKWIEHAQIGALIAIMAGVAYFIIDK